MPVKLTKAEKIKILNADDLYAIMQKILLREDKIDQKREHFWVVGLEVNNRIQYIELISMGSRTKTIAEPMEVFSFALQKKSNKIILVHNHPSGELKPSDSDKEVTDRLIQVGIIVDIPVMDHLIISTKGFTSLEEIGVMSKLRLSEKFVPTYKLIKEAENIAKIGAKLNAMKDMAKKMKARGDSPESIEEITGLPVDYIKKLRVRRKK